MPSAVPYLRGDSRQVDSLLRTMDLDQQIGQLTIYKPRLDQLPQYNDLQAYVRSGRIGGVWLKDLHLLHYLYLLDSLRQDAPFPLMVYSDEPVLHNNYFDGSYPLPVPATFGAARADSLKRHLQQLYVKQSLALGFNLLSPIDLKTEWRDSSLQKALFRQVRQERLIAGIRGFQAFYPQLPDTAKQTRQLLRPVELLAERGLGLIVIDERLPFTDTLDNWSPGFFKNYLRQYLNYQGLIAGVVTPQTPADYLLYLGSDILITDHSPGQTLQDFRTALDEGILDRADLRESARKTLMARRWMYGNPSKPVQRPIKTATAGKEPVAGATSLVQIWNHFRQYDWSYFSYDLYEKSLVIPADGQRYLPWTDLSQTRFRLVTYGEEPFLNFEQYFQKYASFQKVDLTKGFPAGWNPDPYEVHVVVMDEDAPDPVKDTLFRQQLFRMKEAGPMVLVNFGRPEMLSVLDTTFSIIQLFERNKFTEALAAQAFFGGVTVMGHLPWAQGAAFSTGDGKQRSATRLGYGPSQSTGIAPEKLVGIDAIARSAIRYKAMPGCQVVVVKDGKVIYNKAIGNATYDTVHPVQPADLYDVASLTKITATTLVAMKQYDAGQFNLNSPVGQYVGWIPRNALWAIPMRKLLTHNSGLPINLPIAKYVRARKASRRACDTYFCNRQRGPYTVEVANRLYFNRNSYNELRKAAVRSQPRRLRRNYQYSDLNFWLVQQVLEANAKAPLDELAKSQFYQPLGLRRTAFRPLKQYPLKEIIPTELDKTWRRQLVRGYVHDPAAALLGGVSGHAGLFSTAEDIAVLMQLLLQKGSYGGQLFIKPETVQLFTQANHGNHRGLGFDRPAKDNRRARAAEISSKAFGHTGFTGACAWADPRYNLVFVLVSNRVYPKASNYTFLRANVRGRMHQIAYDALDTYSPAFPDLPESGTGRE